MTGPGSSSASPGDCSGPVCITCSDAAVAVTVLELLGDDLALVDTGGGPPEEVSVALVDAAVGDVLLVHAGEAIARPAPVVSEPASASVQQRLREASTERGGGGR